MNMGSRNGRAKLNEKKVREIREHWSMFAGRTDLLAGSGHHNITSQVKLAREYHVAPTTLRMVVKNETWKNV